MAENNNQYVVNGYKFADENDYKAALKEKEGIKYLNSQIDLNDIHKVIKLYYDIVEKNVFHTPIGIGYVKQLRAAIIKHGGSKDLPYVNVPVYEKNNGASDASLQYIKAAADNRNKAKENNNKTKEKLRTSIIINVVLVLLVASMFFVTLSSSNPNIINYERALQDKYAGWAQELTEKEQELRRREEELNRREMESTVDDMREEESVEDN